MSSSVEAPSAVRYAAALIVLAGAAAYCRGLTGPFFFDDRSTILTNPHIRGIADSVRFRDTGPPAPDDGRPLASLTFALNYAVGGLNPVGYHVANLGLHLASALVLFGLIRRTLTTPTVAPWLSERALPVAAASALIWVVHPINSEAVVYVTQRTELLMGLFYLLTLFLARRAHGAERPRPWLWWAAAVASCAASMASKEVAASLPLAVVLYDRAFLWGSFREALRARLPLYGGLAACWALLAALVVYRPGNDSISFSGPVTPWQYLMTESGVLLHYLRLCFWPTPLTVVYDWPIATDWRQAAISGPAVLAMLGAVAWTWGRLPGVAWAASLFFLVLGPTSSFVPILNEVAAERRMYLPSAAVVTLTVLAAVWLGRSVCPPRRGLVATPALTAVLALVTARRCWDYADEVRIWTDTVAKAPGSAIAHNNLGSSLMRAGQPGPAAESYAEAVRLEPDHSGRRFNLGVALARSGKTAEAITHLREAIKLKREFPEAIAELGVLLARTGRPEKAVAAFEDVLRLRPDDHATRVRLARLLSDTGNVGRALAELEETLRRRPDFRPARLAMAEVLSDVRPGRPADPERAVRLARQCLAADGTDAEAWRVLAAAFAAAGRFEDAAESAESALPLAADPDSADRARRARDAYRKGVIPASSSTGGTPPTPPTSEARPE
jgi:Flp pilus assembly protein TadD